MNPTPLLALIHLLIAAFPVASALDANRNGISDVWEAAHPAAAAALHADSDGDGVSNRDEGLAWTDPDDPASVLRPGDFRIEENEVRFGFDGQRWMRDTVVESDDFQSWSRDRQPGSSDGSPVEVARPADGERGFFRIARYAALNSDTDALNNREEEELGTDPLLWDTDGDRVSDDQEFLNGTDPLTSTDSDNDTLPDDWERWCLSFDAGDGFATLADISPATDFDGDGILDGQEFALGTSPVVALKNIVFFLTEDQSPDLGCLGTVGLDTPQLDSLGTSGVIFERAFALSPVCSPSKMALFTGTYPHTNSAYRNVPNYGTDFPLTGDPSQLNLGGVHEDLPTLIEIFRDRGWHTAVSSKSHVQPIRKFPYHQGHGNPGTPAAVTTVVNSTISAAGDRPFFLCFNIGSPHLPFKAVPNANGVWNPTGGLLGDGGVTNVDPNSIVVPNSMPDVPGVRQDWADYYGAIEVIDSIYAAMRDALQANGVLDDTLIVFSGDHGIGLHRFKQSIYGLHVPLLIDGPGVTGGRRLDEPVSHFDLAPTFLDFAGIPAPSSMAGKSLLPVLAGDDGIDDRHTILAACHERYDARAVCDGRYYYVHNIRQVQGATLANPANALNADQFKGGTPWFNRAYDATLTATGTPQRELLRQLVEGELPEFELYDLDADPWCVDNLATDPAHAEIKARLAAELADWRLATEDYNQSPTELVRRSERFVSIDPPPAPEGGLTFADDFDAASGPLDTDPGWSLDLAGNAGAGFTLGGDRVDAPPGPVTLATREDSALPAGSPFHASVTTGFAGSGVASGIAFGIIADGGSHSFWQFMLADGRTTVGGAGKDVRLYRVEQGTQQGSPLLSVNGLTDYPADNTAFPVEVTGQEGSSLVDLRIFDATGATYYENRSFDLGGPIPVGSRFGLTTWSSGSSFFDDFLVRFTGPLSLTLDFEHAGLLDDRPEWSTLVAGNGGTDFSFATDPFDSGNTVTNAPAGPLALATYEPLALPSGSAFEARLEVGFPSSGIFGGLAFGVAGSDDWFSFELADGTTANGAVEDRLFRIRRSQAGSVSILHAPAPGSLPVISRDRRYELVLSGSAGSAEVRCRILDTLTSATLVDTTLDLGAPVPASTRFGLIANSSGSTIYDQLAITITPNP